MPVADNAKDGNNISAAKIMEGVTALDDENGDLTSRITYTIYAEDGTTELEAIPAN